MGTPAKDNRKKQNGPEQVRVRVRVRVRVSVRVS